MEPDTDDHGYFNLNIENSIFFKTERWNRTQLCKTTGNLQRNIHAKKEIPLLKN